MNDDCFAVKVSRKVGKKFTIKEQTEYKREQYYSHPTFYVKNLSEYIQLVTTISSVNKDDLLSETVIFRGMADSEYDLTPGLARLKNSSEDTEGALINDFLTRRPDAFSNLSDFDILAKMQHYGLPTRLLDFTVNPLVALYFACESKISKNGRIVCHNTDLQNDTSVYINEICTTAVRKNFDSNYTVDEYLCKGNLTLRKYLLEAYIFDATTVVRPKYWNQRIANQAGVFMVFPNDLYDRYKWTLVYAEKLGVPTAIKEYFFGKPDENFEKIIKEILLKEPIDYYKKEQDAYLSNKCVRKMINSYKSDNNDTNYWEESKQYFINRFRMSCNLKPLDSEFIKKQFCSIIVDAKSKKRILRELSYIGIGADYIYPELEYTAKEIKRRFE